MPKAARIALFAARIALFAAHNFLFAAAIPLNVLFFVHQQQQFRFLGSRASHQYIYLLRESLRRNARSVSFFEHAPHVHNPQSSAENLSPDGGTPKPAGIRRLRLYSNHAKSPLLQSASPNIPAAGH